MAWTLVTGGAKGLGKEICLTLAKKGHNVLVHFRKSKEEAEAVAEECRKSGVLSKTVQADFSNPEGIQGLLDMARKQTWEIKFLINNVGNFFEGALSDTPVETWHSLFQTNLHAPFLLIRGLLPEIASQKGAVINIGSAGCNDLRGDAKYAAYSLTKRSLYFLTKSFAKEAAKDGVRVNMVSPGELENSVTLAGRREKLPFGRAGALREVAEVVSFLLLPENAYITGQNIEVAGGFAL